MTRVGADGINVDVEVLDPPLVPAFGRFVGRLRDAVRAADPDGEVSVATGAGPLGAGMAAVAADAGVDRIFLMGYDYRVAASSPGASAPLDRSDGGERSLRWSLDLYDALGVPREKLLLGLPLYGMTWPVAGPVIGAPETGRGNAWIPRRNRDLLEDDGAVPVRDEIEQVEVYFVGSDGSRRPSHAGAVRLGDGARSHLDGGARSHLDGGLCRLARDTRAEDGPRERAGTGGVRVLGRRLRAGAAGLPGAHGAVRGGRIAVGVDTPTGLRLYSGIVL